MNSVIVARPTVENIKYNIQQAPLLYLSVNVTVFSSDMAITSVVPGDYDGDSQMDVLLTMSPKGKDTSDTRVFVFWGNNQTLGNLHIYAPTQSLFSFIMFMNNVL